MQVGTVIWNKNVPKVANINGRMTSGSAPSGQSHGGYNHKSGAALNFDAEAYNLIIDVDTATGDTNNFSNATGVFGMVDRVELSIKLMEMLAELPCM